MKSHDDFLQQIKLIGAQQDKLIAAPQDVSMPILQDLLSQGYDTTRWVTDPGSTDSPCLMKDGDVLPLADFIAVGQQHQASFYQSTHVGCRCGVMISGPDLADVFVTAFGIQ